MLSGWLISKVGVSIELLYLYNRRVYSKSVHLTYSNLYLFFEFTQFQVLMIHLEILLK